MDEWADRLNIAGPRERWFRAAFRRRPEADRRNAGIAAGGTRSVRTVSVDNDDRTRGIRGPALV
jgi:hypothetical protein